MVWLCVVANADTSVKILRPYPSNKTVSISSSASFSCHIRTADSTPQKPNVQVHTGYIQGTYRVRLHLVISWWWRTWQILILDWLCSHGTWKDVSPRRSSSDDDATFQVDSWRSLCWVHQLLPEEDCSDGLYCAGKRSEIGYLTDYVTFVASSYVIIIIIMTRRQLRSVATTLHDDRDPVPSSTPVWYSVVIHFQSAWSKSYEDVQELSARQRRAGIRTWQQ